MADLLAVCVDPAVSDTGEDAGTGVGGMGLSAATAAVGLTAAAADDDADEGGVLSAVADFLMAGVADEAGTDAGADAKFFTLDVQPIQTWKSQMMHRHRFLSSMVFLQDTAHFQADDDSYKPI